MRELTVAQQREAATPVQWVTADTLLNRKTELDVMIARRAFELFEGRGGGHGHDVDDWITAELDRKSTRLNSSHGYISYAVFCLKKKKQQASHHMQQHSSDASSRTRMRA